MCSVSVCVCVRILFRRFVRSLVSDIQGFRLKQLKNRVINTCFGRAGKHLIHAFRSETKTDAILIRIEK